MPTPIHQRKILGLRTQPFDASRPLYVRMAFSGHDVGERYDSRGVSPMRLSGLFGARYLTHEQPASTAPPSAA